MSRHLIWIGLVMVTTCLTAQVSSSSSSNVCIPAGTTLTVFGAHTFMGDSQDIWQTDRSDAVGSLLAFGAEGSYGGADATGHVDGSAAYYGRGYFTFPTGQNNIYRPLALSNGLDAIVSYSHNTPPAVSSLDGDVTWIMATGYWQVSADQVGHITLPYDQLAFDNKLTILGYDGTTWLPLASQIDQTAVDMSTSEYRLSSHASDDVSGTITTTDSIVYADYQYYTLGHLTGSGSVAQQQLTIYPNPVPQNGLVIISYNLSQMISGDMTIMDQQDRIIYRRHLHYPSGTLRIRLGGLSPGVYWVMLTDEHGVSVHKQLIIMSR